MNFFINIILTNLVKTEFNKDKINLLKIYEMLKKYKQ